MVRYLDQILKGDSLSLPKYSIFKNEKVHKRLGSLLLAVPTPTSRFPSKSLFHILFYNPANYSFLSWPHFEKNSNDSDTQCS